jgi:hypothetical protein
MSINERNDQLQVIVSFRLVQNKWAVLPSASSSSSPLGVNIESNSIDKIKKFNYLSTLPIHKNKKIMGVRAGIK